MSARTFDFAAVLRDMDIEREMQAAQSRLAAEDLEAEAIAAGIDVISPAMREALVQLAAVIRPADTPWPKAKAVLEAIATEHANRDLCPYWDGEECWSQIEGKRCKCASIKSAPHAHAQKNLLIRRHAVASVRRFAAEPEAMTGFGGLKPDHEASMRATGEWENEAEEEARERAAGFPWGEVE